MLRLLILGPFEAWQGDQLIPKAGWQTRNTLVVLKLLAADRGKFVAAERLADTVWPQSSPAAGRTSLRQSIRVIRQVVGAERIATEGGGYSLLQAGLYLDVDEFTAAAAAGASAERQGDRQAAIGNYRTAASLYRGDYMAEEIYSDWPLERRETLRMRCLDAHEGLARTLIESGNPADAVPVLEQSLAMDPLREELHVMLIRSHALSGRRSHALAAFERCRRVLELELGVEPGPETMALRDEVAALAPLLEGAAPPPRDPAAAFVGRDSELIELERVLSLSALESGRLVLLAGPPGIGKTRLLRQLETRSRVPRMAWLTAHEAESDLAYGPLLSFLNGWLERSASAAQLARLGPYAATLVGLLPGIRLVWGDCPPAVSGEQVTLLEALTRLVLIALGPQPSLLVIDDLHWADAGMLRWLGYGLRRFPPGVATVTTARDTEPGSRALAGLIAAARRSGRLTEITLPPLSAAETAVLVAAGQARSDVELAGAVHGATLGNPLFIIETLRELSRLDGSGSTIPGAPLPLPASVRDAIASRVARLPPRAAKALTAVAVHGAPCRAALVALALEVPGEGVLRELEVLLETDLMDTSEDGQSYVISHPLVRRVVYDNLSPGRRQAWHRRLAAALEALAGGQSGPVAAQILRHLEAGGGSAAEIVRAGRLAGEYALGGHAYAEALDAFGQVQKGLQGMPPGDAVRDQLAHNGERIADALIGLARWDEAILRFEQLLPAVRDPLDGSRLRRKLAQVLSDTGARSLDRALLELDDALGLLEGRIGVEVEVERARVGATRTLAHFHRSEFAEAVAEGQRVLRQFTGLPGVERDVMEQLFRIASAEQRLGRLEAAEARYPGLLRRARAAGDRLAEARFKDAWSVILLHRGLLGEAESRQSEALAAYRSLGVPKFEAIGLGNLGYLLDHQGDLPGSVAAYRSAIALAERIGATYTVVHNRVGLGDVLIRRGEIEAARSELESAIELANEIGTRQRRGHAQLHLADVALLEGDAARALGLVGAGMGAGRAIGDGHSERIGNPILSRILIRLGRPAEALEAARRGLAASRPSFVIDEGRNLLALTRAAGGSEGSRAAAEAVVIFRAAGARALLAEALALMGGPSALEEAAELARSSGAGLLLSRLGQPPDRTRS